MEVEDAIAVVNGDESRTAIWHVDLGPTAQFMSRLRGAWVATNDGVERWVTRNQNGYYPHVFKGRLLLPVGGRIPSPLAPYLSLAAGVIDGEQTRANVLAWVDLLAARHADCPTKAGKERPPISWPNIPSKLDWGNLPSPLTGLVEDELIAATITAARWAAELADAWTSIESERAKRPHLRDDYLGFREIPIAVLEEISK
ncbi:MAG: hypothetical protein U0Q47_01065 [Mycobacterium sp.]